MVEEYDAACCLLDRLEDESPRRRMRRRSEESPDLTRELFFVDRFRSCSAIRPLPMLRTDSKIVCTLGSLTSSVPRMTRAVSDGGVGGGEIKTRYTQLCTIFVSRQLKRTRGLKTDYHNVTNPNCFILIFYLIFNFFDIYFRHTFSIYYIGDLAPEQNKPHRIK